MYGARGPLTKTGSHVFARHIVFLLLGYDALVKTQCCGFFPAAPLLTDTRRSTVGPGMKTVMPYLSRSGRGSCFSGKVHRNGCSDRSNCFSHCTSSCCTHSTCRFSWKWPTSWTSITYPFATSATCSCRIRAKSRLTPYGFLSRDVQCYQRRCEMVLAGMGPQSVHDHQPRKRDR